MLDELQILAEKVRNNPQLTSFGETATKQGIILPFLRVLGWNPDEISEVTPEFSVKGGRVDYALSSNGNLQVFLEVKQTGTDFKQEDEEQLLGYAFHQGVELAVLTNGTTWWLYLPLHKGSWDVRKFNAIDILEQDSPDVALRFVAFLSKEKVVSGTAKASAEQALGSRKRTAELIKHMPQAWNRIVSEPDSFLVDLIAETVEKMCSFKPESSEVAAFLKQHETQFLVNPLPTSKLPVARQVSQTRDSEGWTPKSEGSTKGKTSKQRCKELKLAFIADARRYGITLDQKGREGGRSFVTSSGRVVGITYASASEKNSYWLGLPDEDYHALVFFCESTSRSKLRRFILPHILFRKYKSDWSRTQKGEYHFNIFEREAGKYVLQISGHADEDITNYHDAFESLKD